jgi:hypothetical protein
MASRDRFAIANWRGREHKNAAPQAITASYNQKAGQVVILLSSGLEVRFSPKDAEGLENAKSSQLNEIEISPSGFGIHFPKLDADLYIPALLEGFLGSKKWMAARLGEAGGKSKSLAKKAASRANGKLGGRPRKSKAG